MSKIITYDIYKSALKNKKINELFQSAVEIKDLDKKLSIIYPETLEENDNFFFFVTNYAQRFFQEVLRINFNIDFKELANETFDLTETEIKFKGKDFISLKIINSNGLIKKEYNILD